MLFGLLVACEGKKDNADDVDATEVVDDAVAPADDAAAPADDAAAPADDDCVDGEK